MSLHLPRLIIYTLATLMLFIVSAIAQSLTPQTDPEVIPDVVVTSGENDIVQAWMIAPTTRYPHFVRGTRFEPSGFRVQTRSGQVLTLMLDQDFIFEDRIARLGDLDGDGRDEIIVVLTSLERGSALAAYTIIDEQLVLKARTPFAEQQFRWLNPAGIADYNGDGRLDVALVQKPHLAKFLELWTLEEGQFFRIDKVDSVSNHRNGSPFTQLSASGDFDGDGIVDLAVPSGNRDMIRLLSFANGQTSEINRFPLPARADGDFEITQTVDGWQLLVPLETGERYKISF